MAKKNTFWITIFILPCMALYALIYVVPLLTVIFTSFCEYTAFSKPIFIGLENYKSLFIGNQDFWVAIRNTLVWVIIQCTIHVTIGTLIAILLSHKPFGWKFIRTAYMIPNIIPTAATGVIFFLMANSEFGIIKDIFVLIGLKDSVPNLFGNSNYAFYTVTFTWLLYSAFNTIIIMAEIGAIPDAVFESAKVDGANRFQIDLHIILPMLKNIIATCIILAAVSMISQFDILYVTTKGGPGNVTLNLPVYLYKTATLEMNYAMANTIGVVQIVLGLAMVFAINRIFKIGSSIE